MDEPGEQPVARLWGELSGEGSELKIDQQAGEHRGVLSAVPHLLERPHVDRHGLGQPPRAGWVDRLGAHHTALDLAHLAGEELDVPRRHLFDLILGRPGHQNAEGAWEVAGT
jgi:hypothetical protein